jgi:hypothetical protein
LEADIENFNEYSNIHFPFKADPHLLQNLSFLSIGFPQFEQKPEGDFALPFAWRGTCSFRLARRVAAIQTKTIARIMAAITTATMGQFIPLSAFGVDRDSDFCTRA